MGGSTAEWIGSLLNVIFWLVVIVAVVAALVGASSYVLGAGVASVAGWGQPDFATWMLVAAVLTVLGFLGVVSS